MGIVGGYSIDCYCDDPLHEARYHAAIAAHGRANALHGEQFAGETAGECVAQARGAGWRVSYRGDGEVGAGRATCPRCASAARVGGGG